MNHSLSFNNLNKNHKVVVYLIDTEKNQVLYLRKNHGPKRVKGKLLGFGGDVEDKDKDSDLFNTICNAARRELNEEIEMPLKKQFFSDKPEFIYQGRIFVNKFIIHVLKLEGKFNIPQCTIKKEGELLYRPINYHTTSYDEFPEGEVEMLDKLFFSNEFFEQYY